MKTPNISLITWAYNQIMTLHDSDLTNHLFTTFMTIAVFLGTIQIVRTFSSLLSFFSRQFLRGLFSQNRIFSLYGRAGSWAVVTGGSDGIGLAMCK